MGYAREIVRPATPPQKLDQARRAWSLRSRLLLLVLVTVAPLLALGLALQYVDYLRDKRVASERTLDLARSLALQIGRELEADVRALEVLAKTGRLRRGEMDNFRDLAEAALTDHLEGANILVLDENGQQLMNTALPRGTPLPPRQPRDNTREVFASGEPRVSDVYFGAVVRRPMIAVEVPVKDETGRVMYSLVLDPRPDTFLDIIRKQVARQGTIVALVDRDGTIIARWPDSSKYAGTKAVPALLERLGREGEGVFESKSLDGVPLLKALTRVEPFGWTVGIGTPNAEYMMPIWRSVGVFVAATVLVLLIGLGLARLVSRQITEPMESLAAYAEAARQAGPAPKATGLRETDALAAAIARYVEAQVRAERELVALNSTLEQRVGNAVNERNKAQARLAEAQKMEAVGQLTGGIAHDFNNLLTAIIGSLDLMHKDPAQSPRLQTLTEIALQAAQRGALLVSQLLAFGRRQSLQPQSLRIDQAVEGIRLLIARAAGEEIKLDTHIATDLWPCYADKAQLDSAILNLAFNAHDAMPQGGTLTITAANEHLGTTEAHALDIMGGDYVRITVADTGVGMAPETMARAFEPFFTTKGAGKASGLGLSQVYGFTKQSGGTATIDSRPGGGTTVSMLLPRASIEQPVPPPLPSLHSVSCKTVLVVEDSEVRDLTQSLFESLGHEAIVAPDAASAVSILSGATAVDLLLCDIELGGTLDGLTLGERAMQLRPGLRVLLTSAYPDLVDKQARGTFPIIAKPYQQADLAEKLRALFGAG
jgi:signal transduction histidine kinase